MPVDAVGATPSAASPRMYTTEATRKPRQQLDGEMFLQLLVTQLKYQDPSSPMDASEMLAQTTQLATMEQLTQMAQDSSQNFALQQRSAAAALIGKVVSYLDADGNSVSGTAESVTFGSDSPTVMVDGRPVDFSLVNGVTGAA